MDVTLFQCAIIGSGVRRGLKTVGEAASYNFTTDSCKLWVLKISVLPLNFFQSGLFGFKFCTFGRKFSYKIKILRHFFWQLKI